jgi:hypothetical protein
MSDQLIYSKSYGVVLVDTSMPCITTQWHAFANADEFIDLQEFALSYLETHATPERPWGWVGDARQIGAISAKAQAWLIAEFNPRATSAGLREVSIVVAKNVFGQTAAQGYFAQTRQHPDHGALHTQLYDSLANARHGAQLALALALAAR